MPAPLISNGWMLFEIVISWALVYRPRNPESIVGPLRTLGTHCARGKVVVRTAELSFGVESSVRALPTLTISLSTMKHVLSGFLCG